jgi:8-oxo-dGTP diphosphatase
MPSAEDRVEVAAAAIVAEGRVLAARRIHPEDVAGGWELPGGKIDAGESAAEAVEREVREELGCQVAFVRPLDGRAVIKPGYALTAHLVALVAGSPVPQEHDALRWLSAEELDEVEWLPSDRPFLAELRRILEAGEALPGGNIGGAVRIGRTVRRSAGAWTPAVHALLTHLASAGLDGIPRVLGFDEHGREVLEFLPGSVVEAGTQAPDEPLLIDAMRWLRRFHEAVADFDHPGPWRNGDGSRKPGQITCHHDFAPYNVALSTSAGGDRVVGVFDWDLASPGLPLQDLAFAAWNWVPLWRVMPPGITADRITVMAGAYGGRPTAADIARAVVPRIERSIKVMTEGAAAGDPGMLHLVELGARERTATSLDALRERMPAILALLDN